MLVNSTEMICFVAHDAMIDEHYYYCYKVAISYRGTYSCVLDGDRLENVTGYILNSNVSHLCQAPGSSVMVYFIEIDSRTGRAVQAMLDGQKYLDITTLLSGPVFADLLAKAPLAIQAETMPELANDLLLTLLPTLADQLTPVFDNRVHQIIGYIDEHLHQVLILTELAEIIHLSPERVRHLFKEQVGAPFSQYVLWKRIKSVINAVVNDDVKLSAAALEFGFADQSHFNQVFRRMFGAMPTSVLKNRTHIEFVAPWPKRASNNRLGNTATNLVEIGPVEYRPSLLTP